MAPGIGFFFNFLKSQWTVTPTYPTTTYEGQTVIVTGANVGLGFEAARHITRLGAAKVILAVRSLSKGEEAKKSIEESEKKSGVVEVWQLDLSSYASVEEFASRVNKELPRLDVILENAGIATQDFNLAEGNEATITTNVISTYLLALLVLPKLKETAAKFNKQTYLTIVSSEVHFMTEIPYITKEKDDASVFDILNQNKNMSDRYNVSKLLEVFASRQMVADHMQPKSPEQPYPVISNFINPGLCHSSLMRENVTLGAILKLIMGARTTEVGSRTLVHATHAGPESHGQYLTDCGIHEPAPFVTSEVGKKFQVRWWKELSAKLESIHPGILQNF
jgi:retinol dehydrogenase 12